MDYSRFDQFKEKFAAAGCRFGSGWAWLIKKRAASWNDLDADQDNPLWNGTSDPESMFGSHAYYLIKTPARHIKPVNVVNWTLWPRINSRTAWHAYLNENYLKLQAGYLFRRSPGGFVNSARRIERRRAITTFGM